MCIDRSQVHREAARPQRDQRPRPEGAGGTLNKRHSSNSLNSCGTITAASRLSLKGLSIRNIQNNSRWPDFSQTKRHLINNLSWLHEKSNHSDPTREIVLYLKDNRRTESYRDITHDQPLLCSRMYMQQYFSCLPFWAIGSDFCLSCLCCFTSPNPKLLYFIYFVLFIIYLLLF